MESTIRLFKALPISNRRKKKPAKAILEKTIPLGFTFSPEIVSNYDINDQLINTVSEEIGLTKEQMNNSFHKSWKKIKEASMEQLVFEQIVHYITTYGFEEFGIYNDETVYIPAERLEIPELEKGKIKLTLIKGYTNNELKEKLLKLLQSGIALKEETIDDVIEVAEFVGISGKEIELINNKEVKVRLYDELNQIPENPTEFLRYMVFKTTETSLLIKSNSLIEQIKEKVNSKSTSLLRKYKNTYGLEKLSEIFYRFKPLFLAFKKHKSNRSVINKIRKLAKKNHKPMKEDYLNSITRRLSGSAFKRGVLDKKKLTDELAQANIFRRIRLAYALKFRTKDSDSIVYRIRNGKAYPTEFSFTNKKGAKEALSVVLDSIISDVKKNVKGKKIYIPEGMHYTLPATEKMFTGDLPSGSYVSMKENLICGVHWGQETGSRVDLDLSVISMQGKIGWDSSYRSEERDVLFSGDVTSAPKPKGATELYYFKKQPKNPYLMMVNYYNFSEGDSCDFKILAASEEAQGWKQNYMVNPNNIACLTKTKIDKKQKVLGLVVPQTNGIRFYFAEAYMGTGNSSSCSTKTTQTRDYLYNFYTNSIELKDILEKAGAKFVKDIEKADIDLSLETLQKDSIINLLKHDAFCEDKNNNTWLCKDCNLIKGRCEKHKEFAFSKDGEA